MPTTPDDEDAALQKELATLRILRASLESMKQLVTEMHSDVETAARNYGAVAELEGRWKETVEAVEGTTNERARGK